MSSFDLQKIVRPNIARLTPYASARDEFSGQAAVFLDANENPFGSTIAGEHNRYPDPLQQRLKAALAQHKDVQPAQIFLGNGSDESIDLLIRAFCEPGSDQVLICPPTYGMYAVSAGINNAPVLEVPLDRSFQLDSEAVLAAVQPQTKLMFLCSPNNPTGNALDRDAILALAQRFHGLVVVDEAYIDYAPARSVLPQLRDHANLVVLQTFSKAWGLAELRLGMAFASPEIVRILNKIKPPYNVSGLTQRLGLQALANAAQQQRMVAETLALRAALADGLAALPFVHGVFPSDANFLLVQTRDPRAIYRHLLEEGIVVRDRSSLPGCAGCLRITVGTAAENERLLQALRLYGSTSKPTAP